MQETVKFLLNVGALLVIGGALLRVFFVEVVTVTDNGMAPTLIYGDEILVWKGAHADMADVMVCEHPVRSNERVIGRAVVFAGHTISTDRNALYVDRNATVTQLVASMRFYDVTRKRLFPMWLEQISYFGQHDHEFFLEENTRFSLRTYTVEHGMYLLGDNRTEASFDSREFGEVDPAHCLGQAFLRWKPAPTRDDDDIRHHYLDSLL